MKKRKLFIIIALVILYSICSVDDSSSSLSRPLIFNGYIKNKKNEPIADSLVFIFKKNGKLYYITNTKNGSFQAELRSGEYNIILVYNNKKILEDKFEIKQNSPNEKNFLVTNETINNKKISDVLTLNNFILAVSAAFFSGLFVWIFELRRKTGLAKKYFPYLAGIIRKEIDIFYYFIKENVDKTPEEYSSLIKDRLMFLEDCSDKILKDYNWLIQNLNIKKSRLIIEIKPIITAWLKFLAEPHSGELLLNYFADEHNMAKRKQFAKIIELRNKLDDYKKKLN